MTTPTQSTVWEAGVLKSLHWISENAGPNVTIHLYRGGEFVCVIEGLGPDDGIDWWVVSDCGGGEASDFRVRVFDASNPACFGESSEFTITLPPPP